LGWIVGRMDDPVCGGYVYVRRWNEFGIVNQVWEDSLDSHYHEDGTALDPCRPYAPVAVQGYTYDALLGAADLLDQAPGPLLVATATLRARAARLRWRVLRDFWQPDLGTFAMAMAAEDDGSLRPVRVAASSAGHLLASRLLEGADAAPKRVRLINRMLQPDMLSGAGIRTKSTGAARFRAGSYHNGSSWPMDSGVIADRLRRSGPLAEAGRLDQPVLAGRRPEGGSTGVFRRVAAVPGEVVPGQVVPGNVRAGHGVPGEVVPGQVVPGNVRPGEGIPGDAGERRIDPGQRLAV